MAANSLKITNEFIDDGVDIKRYISLFISNWYWFAIGLFVSLSLAYGINRYSEEIFSVSSSLLLKDPLFGVGQGIDPIFPGSDAFRNQPNLKNEIGILKSYDLNLRVMKMLPEFQVVYGAIGRRNIAEKRLYKNSPFTVEFSRADQEKLRSRIYLTFISDSTFILSSSGKKEDGRQFGFGDMVEIDGARLIIKARENSRFVYDEANSNKYYFYIERLENLANIYRNKLDIRPIEEDATLLILSVSGYVALQEVDYLNELMDQYKSFGLDSKNEIAQNTIDFVEQQIQKISNSLEEAESELEQFRMNNLVIDLSTEGTIIQNKLVDLENEKNTIESKISYYNYLNDYLNNRTSLSDIISPSAMGVNDPALVSIIDELLQKTGQRSEMELQVSQRMPSINLLDSRIGFLKGALRDNINNGLENLVSSLKETESRLKAAEADLLKLPATERELINIQRKFDLTNTVYTYLLEKKAEAEIARASTVPDSRIIDNANEFNRIRIKPRESRNYLTALMLGFFLPVIGLLLIDFFNNRIIDKTDVQRGTRAPILGYISHNDQGNELPVVSKPGSTLAESFRSIRTSIKYFVKEIEHPVIAISSTISSEGKTFVSVNLAAITALLGKRVLLVGLDLRKPRIHKIFDLGNETGVSSYLIGGCDFDEIIFETGVKNLWYVPAGPIPPNPAELIESDRMKQFIAEARDKFDFVIIDTPPVAIVTDALILAPLVDINAFVVRQRYSSKNTLNLIEEFYSSKLLNNLSIIINDISLSGYYGYGLRYGYTLRYGGYSYGYNLYGDYVSSKYGYGNKSSGYYTSSE